MIVLQHTWEHEHGKQRKRLKKERKKEKVIEFKSKKLYEKGNLISVMLGYPERNTYNNVDTWLVALSKVLIKLQYWEDREEDRRCGWDSEGECGVRVHVRHQIFIFLQRKSAKTEKKYQYEYILLENVEETKGKIVQELIVVASGAEDEKLQFLL